MQSTPSPVQPDKSQQGKGTTGTRDFSPSWLRTWNTSVCSPYLQTPQHAADLMQTAWVCFSDGNEEKSVEQNQRNPSCLCIWGVFLPHQLHGQLCNKSTEKWTASSGNEVQQTGRWCTSKRLLKFNTANQQYTNFQGTNPVSAGPPLKSLEGVQFWLLACSRWESAPVSSLWGADFPAAPSRFSLRCRFPALPCAFAPSTPCPAERAQDREFPVRAGWNPDPSEPENCLYTAQ